MSQNIKRNKYIKKQKQEDKKKVQKKPFRILGILTIVGIVILIFVFSNPGRIFFNSLVEEETVVTTPVTPQEKTTQSETTETGNMNIKKDEQVPASNTSAKDITEVKKEVIQPKVEPKQDTYITISLDDLTRKGKYFSHTSGNAVEIKFFGLLDTSGQPHVAFDACDVCYRSKKGYAIQGDMAVCRNCGNRYPVQAIGTENRSGGCWPSYLPIKVTGNEIMIKIEDIETHEFMFS